MRFRIDEAIPIGLEADGRPRPWHTNLVGEVLEGSVQLGQSIRIPLQGGRYETARVQGIMAEFRPDQALFPSTLHEGQIGVLAVSLSPERSVEVRVAEIIEDADAPLDPASPAT